MARAEPEETDATDRRHGILVVDDEEAILESLELTLGDEYRVYTASGGDEALELLEREDIALVISDQVMPGMTGVDCNRSTICATPSS
jgi:DNA-binding NtrC family response regulator